MLSSPDDAELFFKLNRSLMYFANERLGVVPDIAGPDEFSHLAPEFRHEVREAFLGRLDLIEEFVDANPAEFNEEELEIVLSWRQLVPGQFYAFRQLKNYMVFLSTESPAVAYGVVALSEPFENLMGPHLPLMVDAVLMPFRDRIVYDGLLSSYNVFFGGGIKRTLNDEYRAAKERLGIVTSLPVKSNQAPVALPKNSPKRKASKESASNEVKCALEAIVAITDDFCREHLNAEYADQCRKLTTKLSRKRPSPLLHGKPTTWACGILRTIGWVNFLDDRTTQPHIKLTAIDKILGVAVSTGQRKSTEIRRMLKIQRFDVEWTLPSRMDDNPMVWMLQVNGFTMDVRHAPRDVQETAFENGLIPYIPADREIDSADGNDHHSVAARTS